MQSVHASWPGKTFALAARCNDSRGDKKPRSRRSKEERKTMVESFVKKYQNLNNGKFPSLNLTHKEVGGSFYTVREIVREIIQQNRVLGPGDSTSKTLNLQYCPQEQAGESLSMDISASLSISTINHAVDQRQGESLSLHNEYGVTSAVMIEVDESVSQKDIECHPTVAFASHFLDGEKLENLSYKGPKLDKLSGVTNEDSRCEKKPAEAQVHSSDNPGKLKHPFPSCEAMSVTLPQFGSVVNGNENGNTRNDMTGEINFSRANGSQLLSERLSETDISLDLIPSSASHCGREDPSSASVTAGICNAGQSQKKIDAATSLELPKTSESDEMRGPFMAFEKDPSVNRLETTETLSFNVVDASSIAGPNRQLSLEKDLNMDSSEKTGTSSSIAVDEASNGIHNGSISQNFDFPLLGNTSPALHPLLEPNDPANVIANTKSAPAGLIQPGLKKKTFSKVDYHGDCALGNTEIARSYGSTSKDEVIKESETSEANSVWAAIKSLLNAVVKFWVE